MKAHIRKSGLSLVTVLSPINLARAQVSSVFGPTARVTALAWLPKAQVAIRIVSSGHHFSTMLCPDPN